MVVLQYGATKIRHNIRCIKPYISYTNAKNINIENMYDDSQHMITSYILLYSIKSLKQVI